MTIRPLIDSGVLFPLSMTVGAILSVYTSNRAYFALEDVVRPLLLALMTCALLYFGYGLVNVKGGARSLLAGLVLLLLLTYGHLYNVVEGATILGKAVGRHRYLLGVSASLLVLAHLAIISGRVRPTAGLGKSLSVVGAVALALTTASVLGPCACGPQASAGQSSARLPLESIELEMPASPPDIYYIVLDGYGRQDVLLDFYQYDNAGFVAALRNRGFLVAEAASANYIQTRMSLVSALNMAHMDTLLERSGQPGDQFPFASALRDNGVRQLLEAAGYSVYSFETGLPETEWRNADFYLSYQQDPRYGQETLAWRELSMFETLLFETTILRLWYEFNEPAAGPVLSGPFAGAYGQHRARVLYTFKRIGEIAGIAGPKFVFAHVVSPHPPFVFDSQGRPRNPNRPFNMLDGDAFQGSPQEYQDGYRQQLAYVNQLVLPAIDAILEASDRPPVIVLQGDHGPGGYLAWDSVEQTELRERFGILNAYYLPGEQPEEFYPAITPVNSFRLILRHLFNADLDLLPDTRYFSGRRAPFDLIEVPENQVMPPDEVGPARSSMEDLAPWSRLLLPTGRIVGSPGYLGFLHRVGAWW